ncbi:MAG: DNA repair protein RadC [Omnitrophica bacterium]|nr:DNA repair protein RadC [Candidatus Omnitrophota bacterium]
MRNSDKKYKKGINNWPKDERPREKLLRYGEHTLSNSELLAILLRSGVKGYSALDLGREIMLRFKGFRKLAHIDLLEWKDIKGLGAAKISQIKAAVEIGRRFREEDVKENKPKIKSSQDAAEIFLPRMRDLKKEIFKILLLDSKNRAIDCIEIIEGTVNQAQPVIREIFQKCLQYFATSIICIHNHPSGDPSPSKEDKDFTRELSQAGKVLQVPILDHIIIGNNRYYSFADRGNILI